MRRVNTTNFFCLLHLSTTLHRKNRGNEPRRHRCSSFRHGKPGVLYRRPHPRCQCKSDRALPFCGFGRFRGRQTRENPLSRPGAGVPRLTERESSTHIRVGQAQRSPRRALPVRECLSTCRARGRESWRRGVRKKSLISLTQRRNGATGPIPARSDGAWRKTSCAGRCLPCGNGPANGTAKIPVARNATLLHHELSGSMRPRFASVREGGAVA